MIRVLGGDGNAADARLRLRTPSDRRPGAQPWAQSGRPARSISPPALARELVSLRRAGKVFVISDFLMMLNSVERGLGLFTAANMDVSAVQILGGTETRPVRD